MLRLREAGVPVTWGWVLAMYAITVLAIACIWAGPVARWQRPAKVN
jgi:hypothetical protein